MSSVYSSKRSSFSDVVLQDPSKSVPETPAKPHPKPAFRTVPESPEHNRLLSGDYGLDIEILTHKLQLYQLELEEAELRFTQRRMMHDKQAADVAAAARFRDELEKSQSTDGRVEKMSNMNHIRSTSLQTPSTTAPPRASLPLRTTSMRASKRPQPPLVSSMPAQPQEAQSARLPPRTTSMLARSKRPQPLHLSSAPVMPQEVQSAALPVQRNRELDSHVDDMKRHWRRTTIAAGHNAGSTIILVSSPGKIAECEFVTDIPPVPPLSASLSTETSPTTASPLTPLPTEDQIRRELETFAIQEGPHSVLSRRSSVISRKRMAATFVPDEDDKMLPDAPKSPSVVEAPTALVDYGDYEETISASRPTLGRKKSFFSRFGKKNDVDALLDLYMTDEQLVEEKQIKSKPSKSPRAIFFKRWQSSESPASKFERPM